MDRVEHRNRCDDGQPDQHDVEECEIVTVQAKEEQRPGGVQNELQGINRERKDGAGNACLPPNQPAGNSDGKIQDGSHRSEQLVRRPPRRFDQSLVPFARSHQSAGESRQKATGDEPKQHED